MSEDLPFVRAVNTARLAAEFSDAADRPARPYDPPSFVTYFLLGHALELAWKSVLIANGTTDSALRSIGHDLRKARQEAEAILGSTVPTTASVSTVAEGIADLYVAKAFEYVETGYSSLPDPTHASGIVAAYVRSIGAWVDGQVRRRLAAERSSSASER